jgi:hypothetical protein
MNGHQTPTKQLGAGQRLTAGSPYGGTGMGGRTLLVMSFLVEEDYRQQLRPRRFLQGISRAVHCRTVRISKREKISDSTNLTKVGGHSEHDAVPGTLLVPGTVRYQVVQCMS